MRYPLTQARRRTVLDLLAGLSGQRPSIVAEEHLGHEWAPVTRLTFDREIVGVGWTAVAKTRRVDGIGWGGRAHFHREQAGLRTAEPAEVAPRLVASDDQAGVAVMTDLGGWPTVASVLLGDDEVAAASAMIDLGRTVGRLHAATRDAQQLHRQTLMASGTLDRHEDRLGQWPGVDRWHDVEAACADLGLPDARVARDDIASILGQLIDPAPFAALTHLDVNPTNGLVTPDGVKLVDFEGSAFGHIGVDASFLHYPFPNYSATWATLPPEIVIEVDRAYREELAKALPCNDLARYHEMLAIGAAAALAVRVRRLRLLAEQDQPAGGRWRRRAQLVQQIHVFEQLAGRAGCLGSLADWFTRLAATMAHRWPDATTPPPPLFPAFRRQR